MTQFVKYEGLGNDFVVVDERGSAPGNDGPALSSSTRMELCERHTGVGGDGVLTVLGPRTAGAIARMHITNPDGSVPEMCGNGLRCVSLFLVDQGVVAIDVDHVVDTDAGPRTARVLADGTVRVDMGPAMFQAQNHPGWFRERIVVDGAAYLASSVSMGNPHLVLEVEPSVDVARKIGPELERAAPFPQRTNVELADVKKDGTVDVVVWERGVGLTQACGTGACAVAAVLARAGRVPFGVDVVVHLPGGPLKVRVPKETGGTVWMTGAARRVFSGTWARDGDRAV